MAERQRRLHVVEFADTRSHGHYHPLHRVASRPAPRAVASLALVSAFFLCIGDWHRLATDRVAWVATRYFLSSLGFIGLACILERDSGPRVARPFLLLGVFVLLASVALAMFGNLARPIDQMAAGQDLLARDDDAGAADVAGLPLAQGRTGFGGRSLAVIRTTDSSGPAAPRSPTPSSTIRPASRQYPFMAGPPHGVSCGLWDGVSLLFFRARFVACGGRWGFTSFRPLSSARRPRPPRAFARLRARPRAAWPGHA